MSCLNTICKQEIPDEKKNERTVDEILAELDSMTGMANVKKTVHEIIYMAQIQKEQEEKSGIKYAGNYDHNFIITGNAGTGKTIIVRILGALFKAVGFLNTDKIIEIKGNDLICPYIGQSKDKVNEICDAAMGGILFIDEVHALCFDASDNLGNEAIYTLMNRIENDYGKFIVIISDYKDNMEEFLNKGVGYRRKFRHFFCLDDYTEKEGGAA